MNFSDYDSLLIQFTPKNDETKGDADRSGATMMPMKKVQIPDRVPVTLCEPNVLLLDMAEYALDGEPFHPVEVARDRRNNICR